MTTSDTADTRITAAVLTFNEARHLAACLASLAWADEVLVLDSGSTDGTVALAEAMGARVSTAPFVNYSRQRNHALGLVTTTWVLFVDADERVPPALASEIERAVEGAAAGYWIPRRNLFWGRWVRGGGWWPDRQLRLVRTASAHYDPERAVHEVPEVVGPTGELAEPLEHLNYDSWGEFRAKQRAYATLAAAARRAAGDQPRARSYVGRPARELWRRYVTLRGWRDGATGLLLAGHMAYFELVTVRAQRAGPAP